MSKSHVIGWDVALPTPAQFVEFFQQVVKKRITHKRVQGLLNENLALRDGDERYKESRRLLWDDLISPKEIMEQSKEIYPADVLEYLAKTLPDKNTLLWCLANNLFVIASPPKKKSFCEILEENERLIMSDIRLYCDSNIDLLFQDVTRPGWITLSQSMLPPSGEKTLQEQCGLLIQTQKEFLPNAADVLWAILTLKKIRGHRLLNGQSVRTATKIGSDKSVVIGPYSHDGLYIDVVPDDMENEVLGILASR